MKEENTQDKEEYKRIREGNFRRQKYNNDQPGAPEAILFLGSFVILFIRFETPKILMMYTWAHAKCNHKTYFTVSAAGSDSALNAGVLPSALPTWFRCVYKQMLRWFPRFQVATACFSCSPPDLNLLVNNFMFCIHVK